MLYKLSKCVLFDVNILVLTQVLFFMIVIFQKDCQTGRRGLSDR